MKMKSSIQTVLLHLLLSLLYLVSTASPGTTQLPCSRKYNTVPRGTQVEEALDLPLRLDFSVQGPVEAYVTFSPGTKGYDHASFSVGKSLDCMLKCKMLRRK